MELLKQSSRMGFLTYAVSSFIRSFIHSSSQPAIQQCCMVEGGEAEIVITWFLTIHSFSEY